MTDRTKPHSGPAAARDLMFHLRTLADEAADLGFMSTCLAIHEAVEACTSEAIEAVRTRSQLSLH